jgi:HPt (histidine-containing phosphotransfer) domain-containing protein
VPFPPKVVEVDADLSDILPEALEGWRRQVVELRELATSGQTRALRSLAHRMKGGLALYGLEEASAIATRIDAAALHRPNELPARIFTDIDRLRHYLEQVNLRFRE